MKHIKERKKFKIPIIPITVTFMFLLGAGVFLYPTVSNYFAEKNSSVISDEYTKTATLFDDETASREKQKAIEYNEALTGDPVLDPFAKESDVALSSKYTDVLNINGAMCILEIPKIHVKLPVYHGTSKSVLDKAVGHVRQTAVPIGGAGNHPVLTGHTGLSHAKLFTDLIKLETGDLFTIHVLKDVLIYQVDEILIILPTEITKLEPIDGVDCITLVTCYPYGVNSHRLLVRGVRFEPDQGEIEDIMDSQRALWDKLEEYKAIYIVILFVFGLMIAWILYIMFT